MNILNVWSEESRAYWRAEFYDEFGVLRKWTFGKNNPSGYVLHKDTYSKREARKVAMLVAAGLYVKYLYRCGILNTSRTRVGEYKLKQLYKLLFDYHRFYSISQFTADLKDLGFGIDDNLKLTESGNFISSDSVKLKYFSQRNKTYSYYGKKLTLREWSKMVGIPANTLNMRLSRGWGIKKALKTPLMDKTESGSAGANKRWVKHKNERG